jgi:Fe-S cluster assembly scaffold protein SufB
MNSRKLKEFESELKKILLKKEHKILSEDTTVVIEHNCKYSFTIIEDIQLTIIHESEKFSRIEIIVEKNKNLELIEYISNSNAKYKRCTHQEKNTSVKVSQIIFNNKYIKTNSNLYQNTKYELKSAYLNSECESIIINSSTQIEADSDSNLESRGAAKNKAIINNDGIITINEKGNNCSGHQSIKNILLDNTSKINSEPILEIHNHNVTCSHGATTSKIEDEVISYIESRGLTKEQATTMIIEGFFYNSINSLSKENKEIISKIEKKLI